MKKILITRVEGREILDSRGNPTVSARVHLSDGSIGVSAVPSGASTGVHEAVELRDGAKRYQGRGVLKAVKHINTVIAKALVSVSPFDQRAIDTSMCELDATPQKKKLGANAILAVSLATARAAALSRKQPLYAYIRKAYNLKEKKYRMPVPTMNIVNGGRHASNSLSCQEFMIIPSHRKFRERVRIGTEIFHQLATLLSQKGFSTAVGDEGGFAPDLQNNERAIQLILRAVQSAGYVPGKHVYLGLDTASSEFYRGGKYYFDGQKNQTDALAMIATFERWVKRYPIISIEDGLAEDDWEHWGILTQKLGSKIALIGDDLFVTNVERIQRGVNEQVANGVLIKLNQIGTLSETIDAIVLAKKHGYKISISHRSGETADTFIADLAVAVNADFIKSGSLSRSERVEKYNRLMEIEDELGL